MTDKELKKLVGGLAVAQAKTDLQMAETRAQIAETSAQLKRTETLVAETSAQMKRTDEQMKRTDEQMKRTDEKLERIGIRLGNIAENNGSNAEDYFFNSLEAKPELGGIGYDTILKNFMPKSKRGIGEFDIVMINGENIALIECKYKAHLSDVDKLITKQVVNFKKLFPIYAHHKFYLGIASFSFYPELENYAKENGVAILKQKGDVVEIEADNLQAY